MSTQELIELAERYDCSKSIRKNAEDLNIDRNLSISIEMIKRCIDFVQTKVSRRPDSVENNNDIDFVQTKVSRRPDSANNEPEYFKRLDEFYEENGTNIQDVLRYGEPSQFFIQDTMERVDVSKDELNNYFDNRRK